MIEPLPTLPLAHAHSGCTCGEAQGHDAPVLDARTIPHALRHAAIFGALDSLPSGGALVLVAPHDPQPLLAQARDRSPSSTCRPGPRRGTSGCSAPERPCAPTAAAGPSP